jgi:predicted nucleic acid-binding Zn ribbon protein
MKKKCFVCAKPLPEGSNSKRLTCSDACRRKLYLNRLFDRAKKSVLQDLRENKISLNQLEMFDEPAAKKN